MSEFREAVKIHKMDVDTENTIYGVLMCYMTLPFIVCPLGVVTDRTGITSCMISIMAMIVSAVVLNSRYGTKVLSLIQTAAFAVRMILLLPIVILYHGIPNTPHFYDNKIKKWTRLQKARISK